jgi:hypothetical protein
MEVTTNLPMLTNDDFNILLSKGVIKINHYDDNLFIYYL